MKFDFFNKLFGKKNKEKKEDNKELANSVSSGNSVDTNINIEYNDNLIKIEIKKDCSFQEYSSEIGRILQEYPANMDNNNIDMINNLPKRMLISNGIDTINGQTIYLIRNDDYKYIISSNADKLYISETSNVGTEIEESIFKIYFPNREYQIGKYIHGVNRDTSSIKAYRSGMVNSNQPFWMDKEEASSTVKTILQHLEENEKTKDILDLEYINSFLSAIEERAATKTEGNMQDVNEKDDEEVSRS